jgi:hypothetical protein
VVARGLDGVNGAVTHLFYQRSAISMDARESLIQGTVFTQEYLPQSRIVFGGVFRRLISPAISSDSVRIS